MVKKNITIDDLAIMVQDGFRGTAKKDEVNIRFDQVNIRFDQIENRLDRIEKLILEDHKRRIEKLEFQTQEIRDALAIK